MTKRRVVVTGLGAVSPFGIGVDKFWESLIEGKSGKHIDIFNNSTDILILHPKDNDTIKFKAYVYDDNYAPNIALPILKRVTLVNESYGITLFYNELVKEYKEHLGVNVTFDMDIAMRYTLHELIITKDGRRAGNPFIVKVGSKEADVVANKLAKVITDTKVALRDLDIDIQTDWKIPLFDTNNEAVGHIDFVKVTQNEKENRQYILREITASLV